MTIEKKLHDILFRFQYDGDGNRISLDKDIAHATAEIIKLIEGSRLERPLSCEECDIATAKDGEISRIHRLWSKDTAELARLRSALKKIADIEKEPKDKPKIRVVNCNIYPRKGEVLFNIDTGEVNIDGYVIIPKEVMLKEPSEVAKLFDDKLFNNAEDAIKHLHSLKEDE